MKWKTNFSVVRSNIIYAFLSNNNVMNHDTMTTKMQTPCTLDAYIHKCRNISRITENMHGPCAINSLGRVAAQKPRQQLTLRMNGACSHILCLVYYIMQTCMILMMICHVSTHCTSTHNMQPVIVIISKANSRHPISFEMFKC